METYNDPRYNKNNEDSDFDESFGGGFNRDEEEDNSDERRIYDDGIDRRGDDELEED